MHGHRDVEAEGKVVEHGHAEEQDDLDEPPVDWDCVRLEKGRALCVKMVDEPLGGHEQELGERYEMSALRLYPGGHQPLRACTRPPSVGGRESDVSGKTYFTMASSANTCPPPPRRTLANGCPVPSLHHACPTWPFRLRGTHVRAAPAEDQRDHNGCLHPGRDGALGEG